MSVPGVSQYGAELSRQQVEQIQQVVDARAQRESSASSSEESFIREVSHEVGQAIRLFDARWGKWSGRMVVLFGSTGVGKTTLLQILAEANLECQRDQKLGDPKVGVRDGEKKLPVARISHGKASETTTPNKLVVEDKEGPLAYADCPGLYDTGEGPAQIRNAILIQKLFERASTIKLVVVLTEDDLTRRAASLFNAVRGIGDLFGESMSLLERSVSLVVSKAGPKFNATHARNNIDAMVGQVPALKLYESLLSELKKRVTVIPRPSFRDGDKELDFKECRQVFLKNIEECEWGPNVRVVPCVAEESKLDLAAMYEHLVETVEQGINIFIAGFNGAIGRLAGLSGGYSQLDELEKEKFRERLQQMFGLSKQVPENGILWTGWDEAAFQQLVKVFSAMANRCGEVASLRAVEGVLEKIPSLLYLEKFLPGRVGKLPQMIRPLVQVADASRLTLELALMKLDEADAQLVAASSKQARDNAEERRREVEAQLREVNARLSK